MLCTLLLPFPPFIVLVVHVLSIVFIIKTLNSKKKKKNQTNASRMDYCNTALTTKLQQVQVHNCDQNSSDSNTNDDTICSKDNTIDNSDTKHSSHDNSLNTNSTGSSISDCYCVFDLGGSRFNNKAKVTSMYKDGNSNSNSPLSVYATHNFGN
jgi:hypothetical protein